MSENVSIFTTLISLIELAHFFCLFEGAAYFGNNVLTKFAWNQQILRNKINCMILNHFLKCTTFSQLLFYLIFSWIGWFSLVTSKGQTAGYFNTIDEVGRARVLYFLTRDQVSGYIAPRNRTISKSYNHFHEPVKIAGGTVLRLLGVFEDMSRFLFGKKLKNSVRGKNSKHFIPEPGPRYAKCIYFNNYPGGEIVYIPISHVGR